MTDRYAGFLVTLDHDTREDDAEAIMAAIRQLRGVLEVKPVVSTYEVDIAEARAKRAILDRIQATLDHLRREG